jgi:hypothetical protein
VMPSQMCIKHAAEESFLIQRIAAETKPHRVTNRAASFKEIVVGLGMYDQFSFFHANSHSVDPDVPPKLSYGLRTLLGGHHR